MSGLEIRLLPSDLFFRKFVIIIIIIIMYIYTRGLISPVSQENFVISGERRAVVNNVLQNLQRKDFFAS